MEKRNYNNESSGQELDKKAAKDPSSTTSTGTEGRRRSATSASAFFQNRRSSIRASIKKITRGSDAGRSSKNVQKMQPFTPEESASTENTNPRIHFDENTGWQRVGVQGRRSFGGQGEEKIAHDLSLGGDNSKKNRSMSCAVPQGPHGPASRYHAYRSHVTKAPQPEIIDEPDRKSDVQTPTEKSEASSQSRFIKSQRLRSIFYSSKTAALLAFSSVHKSLSSQLTSEQAPSIEIEGPNLSEGDEKDKILPTSGKGKRNLSAGDAVNVSFSQEKEETGVDTDHSLPATPCKRPNPVVRLQKEDSKEQWRDDGVIMCSTYPDPTFDEGLDCIVNSRTPKKRFPWKEGKKNRSNSMFPRAGEDEFFFSRYHGGHHNNDMVISQEGSRDSGIVFGIGDNSVSLRRKLFGYQTSGSKSNESEDISMVNNSELNKFRRYSPTQKHRSVRCNSSAMYNSSAANNHLTTNNKNTSDNHQNRNTPTTSSAASTSSSHYANNNRIPTSTTTHHIGFASKHHPPIKDTSSQNLLTVNYNQEQHHKRHRPRLRDTLLNLKELDIFKRGAFSMDAQGDAGLKVPSLEVDAKGRRGSISRAHTADCSDPCQTPPSTMFTRKRVTRGETICGGYGIFMDFSMNERFIHTYCYGKGEKLRLIYVYKRFCLKKN